MSSSYSNTKAIEFSKGDMMNKNIEIYNYDSNGNVLKVNRDEYHNAGFVDENADYILSKQEIPEDIAKLMFENDYAFAKDDIDAMINLIKDEKADGQKCTLLSGASSGTGFPFPTTIGRKMMALENIQKGGKQK